MFECIVKSAKSVVRNNEFSLFANSKDYIEEYSKFSNLILENFSLLFLYYFLFCSLVFAVAFGHHVLVMITKMMTRRKNLRLKRLARKRPLCRQMKIGVRNTNDFYSPPAVDFPGYRRNYQVL